MALVITEEQKLLKESARDFLNEHGSIPVMRELRDQDHPTRYADNIWSAMSEMGWAGLIIPEEYGGMAFDYCGMGQILEETGRTLTSSPLFATSLVSASLLLESASDTQKQTFLTAIAAGEMKISLASEEGGHHNPKKLSCTATEQEGKYILNGTKNYVLDGNSADQFIVVARTSGEDNKASGISLFMVDAKSSGLTIQREILMDSRAYASIELKDVSIDASSLIGEKDKGYKALQKAIDIGTIGLSAELLGIMQEAFERTIAYLKERKQFGKTIGSFQALQHRAAVMYSEIEICKSLVLKGLQGIDENSFMLQALASMAKAKCCKTAQLVTNEGVQLFGGVGMTDDEEIGFFLKRARVAMELFGNYNYHLDRFANLNGY